MKLWATLDLLQSRAHRAGASTLALSRSTGALLANASQGRGRSKGRSKDSSEDSTWMH